MVVKSLVLDHLLAVSLVGANLQSLHSLEQVIKSVKGILVKTGSSRLNNLPLGFFFVEQIEHLFLKLLNSNDGVLRRVLAGEHVHQLSHVESIALNLRHDHGLSVLKLIDVFLVLINDCLVVINESSDSLLVERHVHLNVLDAHMIS